MIYPMLDSLGYVYDAGLVWLIIIVLNLFGWLLLELSFEDEGDDDPEDWTQPEDSGEDGE